jgi:hypothetical protein
MGTSCTDPMPVSTRQLSPHPFKSSRDGISRDFSTTSPTTSTRLFGCFSLEYWCWYFCWRWLINLNGCACAHGLGIVALTKTMGSGMWHMAGVAHRGTCAGMGRTYVCQEEKFLARVDRRGCRSSKEGWVWYPNPWFNRNDRILVI